MKSHQKEPWNHIFKVQCILEKKDFSVQNYNFQFFVVQTAKNVKNLKSSRFLRQIQFFV